MIPPEIIEKIENALKSLVLDEWLSVIVFDNRQISSNAVQDAILFLIQEAKK